MEVHPVYQYCGKLLKSKDEHGNISDAAIVYRPPFLSQYKHKRHATEECNRVANITILCLQIIQ